MTLQFAAVNISCPCGRPIAHLGQLVTHCLALEIANGDTVETFIFTIPADAPRRYLLYTA